jgi:hypothetical protein
MVEGAERRPAARASAARDNVAYVDVYRPGSLAEVRSLIPAESLEAIDRTPGFSWLEFEHDHWLMDATLEVLGQRDAIECWRRSISKLVEKPLLRNFVEGSLRLFGKRPGKLLTVVPRGWTLAYRDFCVPRYESLGDYSARLHFEDIAPQAFQSEGYLHCWHGICLGLFELEKPPNAHVDFEIERGRARAVASFSWS